MKTIKREYTHKGSTEAGELPISEIVTETLDSVEVSKNAKGDYTWSIKLYAEKAEDTLHRIEDISKTLESIYVRKNETK